MPSSTALNQQERYLYQPMPAHANALRVAWFYPYTYSVSMSSLGYLNLFRMLDERPDVAVERYNTESCDHISLFQTHVMGLSFSFELDIVEILRSFKRMKIPYYAAERGNEFPLIFAGGPVIITNPEPYAPFFDFFVIGDGEPTLGPLVEVLKETQHITKKRDRLYAIAKAVPGIYVPSLVDVDYEPGGPIRSIDPLIPNLPFPINKQPATDSIAYSPIVTPNSVFANTFLVEVMRGCAHRCRFCLASYSALPARGPSLEQIQSAIESGLSVTNKVGLLGALITEHPEFDTLCDYLNSKNNIEVTAASVRADTLTPHRVQTLKNGGQQTLTIAVETGSERLRKRINKHLKTEAILNAADIITQVGIPNLKLYMMVGLPDETGEDLAETVDLVKALKKSHPTLKLHFGCSTFVPKAATPFQWVAREDTKLLENKLIYLRKHLAKYCSFRPSSPNWDTVQAWLSRGDRRLAPFLVDFVEQGANLGAVNRALKYGEYDSLPDLDWYANRARNEHEILPWDMLHLGVPKATLYKESGLP